ncbi:MAG: HAD family hydrolase [Clostridia bacterium]|nr:HAD family hydrolase [Clostridia bacterium]
MIKACLFDLDGTLLDTLTTISYYANLALAKYGIEPIDKERYKYLVGDGAKILIERMLKERDCFSAELYEKVYGFYNESYDANPTYLTEPYPGITDMLCELKKRGITAGVISNKPDYAARSVCTAKFPEGLLHTVRGQVEGVRIKPDPQGAYMTLDTMNVKSDEIIYVGDTGVDMVTGKNLGAYTVGVQWGFRDSAELMENGADEVISEPHELIKIINKINI